MKISRFYLTVVIALFCYLGYSQSKFTVHTGMTYSSVRPFTPGDPPAPDLEFKSYYYVGVGVNSLISSSTSVNVRLQQALRGGSFQPIFGNEQSWKYSFLELSLAGEKKFFDRIGVYGGAMVGKMTNVYGRNGQDAFQRIDPGEFHTKLQYGALVGVKYYVNTIAILIDYNHYFQPLICLPIPQNVLGISGFYKEKLRSFSAGLELYF